MINPSAIWRVLCDLRGMMSGLLLRFVLLLGLFALVPAVAVAQDTPAPTESESSDEESESESTNRGFSAGSLFNPVGLPLLRVSGPQYLHLGLRPKLRFQGVNGDSGASEGGASSGGGAGLGSVIDTGVGFGDADDLPWDVPGQVPEPALLSLMVPAFWLAIRRRAQRQSRHD